MIMNRCIRCCSLEDVKDRIQKITYKTTEIYQASIPVCSKCDKGLERFLSLKEILRKLILYSLIALIYLLVDFFYIHTIAGGYELILILIIIFIFIVLTTILINYSKYTLESIVKYKYKIDQVLIKPKCIRQWIDLRSWKENPDGYIS